MKIIQADLTHVDEVANLFNQYRIFYEKTPDLDGCKNFIQKRMERRESVIFISITEDGEISGFTQLYPSFCSVSLKPILYLYDLYVSKQFRRRGHGKLLLDRAMHYAEEMKADRLTLETVKDNFSAQALYESSGYERDAEFITFHLEI